MFEVALCLGAMILAEAPAKIPEFRARHIFVADIGEDAIAEYEGNGTFVGWLGNDDPDYPSFVDPFGLAFGPDGRLYVSSESTGELFALTPAGIDAVRPDDGTLASPRGMTFGPRGRLYVASHGNDQIAVFDRDLTAVTTFSCPAGLRKPTDVAFDPDGRLWVASEQGAALWVLDESTGAVGPTITLAGAPAGIGLGNDWVMTASVPSVDYFQFATLFNPLADSSAYQGPIPFDAAVMGHVLHNVLLFRGADLILRPQYGAFDSISFGPSELSDPVAVAVAPWRFSVTISGRGISEKAYTVEQPAPSKGHKLVEKAKLSLYPGTFQAYLQLDPEGTLASADWFQESVFVLTGSTRRFITGTFDPNSSFDQAVTGSFEQRRLPGTDAPSARLVVNHGLKKDGFARMVKAVNGKLQLALQTDKSTRAFAGSIKKAKLTNKD